MSKSDITDIKSLRERMEGRMRGSAKPASSGDSMITSVLRSKEFLNELRLCVPMGVNFDVERLARVVQTQLREDAKLAAAEPRSVLGAVMKCAEIGLMPGFMGHAYLTTRAKVGAGSGFAYEATLIPGYKGLIAIAMRSGEIQSITSRIVTDREIAENLFELHYEGDRDFLKHKPILLGDKGSPALVYCLVRFAGDGGVFHVEPMSADEIYEIKYRAVEAWDPANGPSAWETDEMEMWRKTPIRRAIKYLNISVEGMSQVLDLDDKVHGGKSQDLEKAFGTEATPASTESVVAEKKVPAVFPKVEKSSVGVEVDPDAPDAGMVAVG